MAKIFQIDFDIEAYAFCALDDYDIVEKMEDFAINTIGTPLSFEWIAPGVEFMANDDGITLRPDLTQWAGNDLIVSKLAAEYLAEFLTSKVVEKYPLAKEGVDYIYINPIIRLGNEVIDTNKTKFSYFDDGTVDNIEILVFKKTAMNNAPPLFTLDINGGGYLYCNEDFYKEVTKNNFGGLVFTEVDQV